MALDAVTRPAVCADPDSKSRIPWAAFLVLAATAGLAARLFHLIDLHAVDLLFYDQIELYEAFLDDPSAWTLFRWQHGPHRQGLPFLATRLIAEWTDWNVRADAFHVFAWMLLAVALAITLRRRLFGPLSATDVAIPLLLLTPAAYGIYVHASNASHCAGPLALLLAFCHALLIQSRRWRYASLVALDFVLVHTGFAVFAGALAPLLLALAAWRDQREARPRDALFAGAGVVLCLVWIGVFLIGYTAHNGLDAVEEPLDLARHSVYVAMMFANLLGFKDPGAPTIAIGALPALAALALAIGALVRLAQRHAAAAAVPTPSVSTMGSASESPRRPALTALAPVSASAASVIFFLAAFTLLYCVATAVGRIQFGLSGAQSSRYVPLVAPAFLALYFATFRLERRALRLALGLLLVGVLVRASFPMHPLEAGFMTKLADHKRAFVAAYLETGNIEAASRQARLRIDPFRDPRRSTDETFAWLRANEKSFFAKRSRLDR